MPDPTELHNPIRKEAEMKLRSMLSDPDERKRIDKAMDRIIKEDGGFKLAGKTSKENEESAKVFFMVLEETGINQVLGGKDPKGVIDFYNDVSSKMRKEEEAKANSAVVVRDLRDELTEEQKLKFSQYRMTVDKDGRPPSREDEEKFVESLISEGDTGPVSEPVEIETTEDAPEIIRVKSQVIDDDKTRDIVNPSEESDKDDVVEGVWRYETNDRSRSETGTEQGVWYEGIIKDLRDATNINVSSEDRLNAIRRLEENGVNLPEIKLDPTETPVSHESQGNKNRFKIGSAVDFIEGGQNDLWSSKEEALRYLKDELEIRVDALQNMTGQEESGSPTPHVPEPEEAPEGDRDQNRFDDDITDIRGLTDPRDRVEALSSMRRDLLRKKPLGWAEKVQRLRELEDREGVQNPKEGEIYRIKEYDLDANAQAELRSIMHFTIEASFNTTMSKSAIVEQSLIIYLKKRVGQGQGRIPEAMRLAFEAEAQVKIELHAVSIFWNLMKVDGQPDADVYETMKRKLDNPPAISKETYDWLTSHNQFVYTRENGTIVEIADLTKEMNRSLSVLYEAMKPGKELDPSNTNLSIWKIKQYAQTPSSLREDMIKELGLDPKVGLMAWQLIEAEGWEAEIPGSLDPRRRLVRFEEFRMERQSKNLSVPCGTRLYREYQDEHGGRDPSISFAWMDENGIYLNKKMEAVHIDRVFRPEGVRWARSGFDMWGDRGNAVRSIISEQYLDRLAAVRESQPADLKDLNVIQMQDLSSAAAIYDHLALLGGKKSTELGTGWIGKLNGSLFPNLLRIESLDKTKIDIRRLSFEWTKTLLWINSPANIDCPEENLVKLVEIEELFTRILKGYDPNNEVGKYIGNHLVSKEKTARKAEIERLKSETKAFVAWFVNDLWKKRIYRIVRNEFFDVRRLPPALQNRAKTLGSDYRRQNVGHTGIDINSYMGGMFEEKYWFTRK